jgi:integrase
MKLIRSILEDIGDVRMTLATAIGAESGLRISEVCNLRISDVDLVKQQFFVRLPNKTRTERYVPFHKLTKEALVSWLSARPVVDHDFLLTARNGIPLRAPQLRLWLNKALCGPGKLKQFSFHRFRHYAASRVYPHMGVIGVMRTFGWSSPQVMQGYTDVPSGAMRESYIRAMDTLASPEVAETPRSTSIEAYFDQTKPPK